jgi:hypothetical protein
MHAVVLHLWIHSNFMQIFDFNDQGQGSKAGAQRTGWRIVRLSHCEPFNTNSQGSERRQRSIQSVSCRWARNHSKIKTERIEHRL